MGSATARLSGTFELTSARGLRCWALTRINGICAASFPVLRFHLSDGRSGTGLIRFGMSSALAASGTGRRQ